MTEHLPECQFVEMTERDYEANNAFYAPPDCQCKLIAKARNDQASTRGRRNE